MISVAGPEAAARPVLGHAAASQPVFGDAAAAQPVPGFEHSAYRLLQGRVVWAGSNARTDHPRHLHKPWQPPARRYRPGDLVRGAGAIRAALGTPHLPVRGLLVWLTGQALPFPWQAAQRRLDALAQALGAHDLPAFGAAAQTVLGLGPGLTPSGDDLVGGLMFTFSKAPPAPWRGRLRPLRRDLHKAAVSATNAISAALLDDLMDGRSYRLLHELFDAMAAYRPPGACWSSPFPGRQHADMSDADAEADADPQARLALLGAASALLQLGASSGADLLCGVLLALTGPPAANEVHFNHPQPCVSIPVHP